MLYSADNYFPYEKQFLAYYRMLVETEHLTMGHQGDHASWAVQHELNVQNSLIKWKQHWRSGSSKPGKVAWTNIA